MFPIQDSVPSRSVPVVTRALILINVLVFFFELALPKQGLEQLFYLFGIVPARFTHPDWASYVGFPVDGYWTILTYQFLHGGWLHIVANMWTLWIFGDNVEDRMGSLRFVIFYLICGSIAGFTQLLTNPDSTIPSIGASGAIAGVLGAYLMFFSDGATNCSISDRLFSILFRSAGRILSCSLVLHSAFQRHGCVGWSGAGRRHCVVGARGWVREWDASVSIVCAAASAIATG
jgi:membrane associated rhomboid family serine protease